MFLLTRDELEAEQKQQLTQLIDQAGGVSHLSKMLNINIATVKGWEERGRISKKGAELVGEHGNLGEHFKAIALRPDLNI